jgi:hypothetical protein
MSFTKRILILASFALGCWFPPRLFAQTAIPIHAELIQRLNARKVKVGDPILAKLVLPWKSPECDLRSGAIIQGHVVTQKAHSKTEKISEIGITFESGQCGGPEMKPLFLTLAAVLGPYPPSYSDSEEMQPLNSATGLGLNGGMRSLSQAAATINVEPRRAKAPRSVTAGQVVGIPHVAISVGQPPDWASVLRSTGRDVQLSGGTQLVLVPNVSSERTVGAEAKSANPIGAIPNTAASDPIPAITEPPPLSIADEKELCEAPDCSIAVAADQSDQGNHGAQITLSLKGLGYLPAPADQEMFSFDYDASIAYLGPHQFLFSFNPHTLVQRSAVEAVSSRRLRVIRGVLIDLEKKKVARTVDWRVPDIGRYLWPIGDNRVLVHVGHELRVYGPGLQLSDHIPLGGPLAFLQISPASEFFAVGVIHERHTREIHRQLEIAELREPEEDVEIRLLDSRFRSLTTIMRSSRFPPPVLLNEGEVHISSIGRNRWQIMEHSWSGQRRLLAVASSTCTPQADSMPGNLLFVFGCEGERRWYRVLRDNGKVVLKGRSSPLEAGQTAGGNIGSNAFAIRIAESAKSRSLQSVFKPSELKGSHVAVYRAKNGRRIFSIGMRDLVPAVQAFAISPREDQMAFLKASEIAFYQLRVGE